MVAEDYQYILGGRLKNESEVIKNRVLEMKLIEGQPQELRHSNGRLVVTYSSSRSHNDKANRVKGLIRLEKKVKTGKLTKEHINNRGYNKYLALTGNATIAIDYQKFNEDSLWDGLKGYITNTTLSPKNVVVNYGQLWQIEKAFRISKSDLRIRPIYHRIRERIEAHLCICFCAYKIYKELERLLKLNNISLSAEKALKEINNMRQINYILPKSKQVKKKLLRLNSIQNQLIKMKF